MGRVLEFRLRTDYTHEQALVQALALVGIHQRVQAVQSRALVLVAVPHEHVVEHLVIAPGERSAEQRVRDDEQRHRAQGEQPGVPQPEPQRQRVADRVTPL
jgi:hypothetical protein